MSVFFKTGDNMAVGVPWPVYLFVVLPFQALWWMTRLVWLFFKAVGLFLVAAWAVALVLVRTVRSRQSGDDEERPPA